MSEEDDPGTQVAFEMKISLSFSTHFLKSSIELLFPAQMGLDIVPDFDTDITEMIFRYLYSEDDSSTYHY